MACPMCGATAFTLVAQGVAECDGTISYPTGAHPSGAMGPTVGYRRCGMRYQVPVAGGPAEFCSCGMGAVARCVVCSVPLCLDDSFRTTDGILCGQHAAEARSRAAAAAQERLDSALGRITKAAERLRVGNVTLLRPDFQVVSWFGASQANLTAVPVGEA